MLQHRVEVASNFVSQPANTFACFLVLVSVTIFPNRLHQSAMFRTRIAPCYACPYLTSRHGFTPANEPIRSNRKHILLAKLGCKPWDQPRQGAYILFIQGKPSTRECRLYAAESHGNVRKRSIAPDSDFLRGVSLMRSVALAALACVNKR